MDDEEKSRIERLQERLYSPNAEPIQKGKRVPLKQKAYSLQNTWHDDQSAVDYTVGRKRPLISPFIKKFLSFSLVFFVIALGISAYFFYFGGNVVSSDNVSIDIVAPVSVGGGEQFPIQLTFKNENNVSLQSVELIVEFPDGARSPQDVSVALPRYSKRIDDIVPGGTARETVDVVIFGEERSEKPILVRLQYRVEGSNAIFAKEKEYVPTIGSAPMLITVDTLQEVNAGQDFDIVVTLTSNSINVIDDLALKVEYPPGFVFVSSSPEPIAGDNVWGLGDVLPEGKRSVRLRGHIDAQDSEDRAFRFIAGIQNPRDPRAIDTPFLSATNEVRVRKPFITTELVFNGSTDNPYITSSGRTIRGDLRWKNNLPSDVSDLEILVTFEGDVLDERSVSAVSGFYRSTDNTIVWNKQTKSDFVSVGPGVTGSLSFAFAPQKFSANNVALFRNPELRVVVTIRGKRLAENNVPETVTLANSSVVRITTNPILTPRLVYSTGPFTNTGGLPPRADQETTYTVIWTVTNTINDVNDARVSVTLPTYVRFLGTVSPSQEKVTFNELGGQIVWDLGTIPAGAGILSKPREVAFQVVFTPSISQIGSLPILVNEATLFGTDVFTGDLVSVSTQNMTTYLSTDPQYQDDDGRVTK